MSTALESYKADNGIYPRDNNSNGYTDALNAKASPTPLPAASPSAYTKASYYLYSELSGLDASQQPRANAKPYFSFKPQMLSGSSTNGVLTTVGMIRDPWDNSYGYSTASQADPTKGYNPTFDLWSTANDTSGNTAKWVKNW